MADGYLVPCFGLLASCGSLMVFWTFGDLVRHRSSKKAVELSKGGFSHPCALCSGVGIPHIEFFNLSLCKSVETCVVTVHACHPSLSLFSLCPATLAVHEFCLTCFILGLIAHRYIGFFESLVDIYIYICQCYKVFNHSRLKSCVQWVAHLRP